MKNILLATCCFTAITVSAHAQGANSTSSAENATPAGKGGQSQSQGAASPNETTGNGQLETIVVTAQKRSEVSQKIPITVATVSTQTLSRTGVRDFDALQKVLPDVHVEDIAGGTNLSIRGVREPTLGPTSDSSTAVHLDGIYLSRPTGLTGLFYDIARLEELPGPQGTLYGRNATAGVINLITNKPTDTFGGYLEAEGGSYGLYRTNGAVNGPLNPHIDLRAAFHVYHHDGYFSNGFDDADEKGGRLSAKIKFSPGNTLLLSGDYEVSRDSGIGSALLDETFSAAPPLLGKRPPKTATVSDPFTVNPSLYPFGRGPSFDQSRVYGGMAQLDDDLGFATLTTQLGVRRVDYNGAAINLNNPGPFGGVGAIGYSTVPADSTTGSAEIRLASASKTPFQWVAGLFYFTEKSSGVLCAHASLTDPGCGGLEFANPFQRTISYAGFGQATYTPPILDSKLHLTGGLRYNTDQKNGNSYVTAAFAPIFGHGNFLSNDPHLHATFSALTYKLEVAYDITPQNLIYAQNSTGFRSGGFAFGNEPLYQPETIQAYEIGSKNRFMDNAMQVNLAAFHYNYYNQEHIVAAPPPPGYPAFIPFSDFSVQSLGKAHYDGASVALEWAVTPDDRVELNTQYLDAHYVTYRTPSRFINGFPLNPVTGFPTGETPGSQDGLQVQNTPPWSGTFAYDHSVQAFSGTFDGRAAIQWSAEQHFLEYPTDSLQYKVGTNGAYARLDLSVSFVPDHGGWRATAYVNNVTDERTFFDNRYEFQFGSGTTDGAIFPPRTFGVILADKF